MIDSDIRCISIASLTHLNLVTYKRERTSLVQITGCHLCGTRPLSGPMLSDCQLVPEDQTSIVFKSKYTSFIENEELENIALRWWPFCHMPHWANMISAPLIINYVNSKYLQHADSWTTPWWHGIELGHLKSKWDGHLVCVPYHHKTCQMQNV